MSVHSAKVEPLQANEGELRLTGKGAELGFQRMAAETDQQVCGGSIQEQPSNILTFMKRILFAIAGVALITACFYFLSPAYSTAQVTTNQTTDSHYERALNQQAERMKRYEDLLRSQEEIHKRSAALVAKQEQRMTRQEADFARYEKILDTWEKQQQQYQRYLDSLTKQSK